MSLQAAVPWEAGQDCEIGEVKVELAASGLCHLEEHVRDQTVVVVDPSSFERDQANLFGVAQTDVSLSLFDLTATRAYSLDQVNDGSKKCAMPSTFAD